MNIDDPPGMVGVGLISLSVAMIALFTLTYLQGQRNERASREIIQKLNALPTASASPTFDDPQRAYAAKR